MRNSEWKEINIELERFANDINSECKRWTKVFKDEIAILTEDINEIQRTMLNMNTYASLEKRLSAIEESIKENENKTPFTRESPFRMNVYCNDCGMIVWRMEDMPYDISNELRQDIGNEMMRHECR